MRYFHTLLVALFLLYAGACKKEAIDDNTELVEADSSSFSALVVACTMTDPTATGIVVVDIQKFFLNGQEAAKTVNGRIFRVKTSNEDSYKGVIDKVAEDLQFNPAYFKNYKSFTAIFDEQFKGKTGFMGSSDLTKEQAEDLFGGKDLTVSWTQGLRTSEGEIYKVRNFWLAAHVSDRIGSGHIIDYRELKRFFAEGMPTKRSTALFTSDQIFTASYNGADYLGGYSYNYPLPPLWYGAPTWFWEQIIVWGPSDPFLLIPENAEVKGVFNPNFNDSQNLELFSNAKVVGANLEFEYPSKGESGVFLKGLVDVSNGFETSFQFSGSAGQFLEVVIPTASWSTVRLYGINNPGNYQVALPIASMPSNIKYGNLFDGRDHNVKITLTNRSPTGIEVKIFIDDMNSAAFYGISNIAVNIKSMLTVVDGEPNALRRVRLKAWSSVGEGKITIKNWSFRAL